MTRREHCTVTDPLEIRRALDLSDRQTHVSTAAEFGVAVSTLTIWRNRRADAAGRGEQWPSDADVTAWQASKARRDKVRTTRLRWLLRCSRVAGPMLIDSSGTTRRLQALLAIGWRLGDLAARLGVVTSRVGHLAGGTSSAVHRDTAAAIAALYDQLSMTPGPSARNRSLAVGRRWAGPLCWDDETIDDPKARPRRTGGRKGERSHLLDEIAVERAMAGDDVHLTPAERAEVVRRLTANGLSAAQIAVRLRTTPRSVTRTRTAA